MMEAGFRVGWNIVMVEVGGLTEQVESQTSLVGFEVVAFGLSRSD